MIGLSISTRVALYVMALLAVLFTGFGLVIYSETRSGVLAEAKRDVSARTAAIAAAVSIDAGGPLPTGQIDALAAPDLLVQIHDARGTTLMRSANLRGADLPLRREPGAIGQVEEVRMPGWCCTRAQWRSHRRAR